MFSGFLRHLLTTAEILVGVYRFTNDVDASAAIVTYSCGFGSPYPDCSNNRFVVQIESVVTLASFVSLQH